MKTIGVCTDVKIGSKLLFRLPYFAIVRKFDLHDSSSQLHSYIPIVTNSRWMIEFPLQTLLLLKRTYFSQNTRTKKHIKRKQERINLNFNMRLTKSILYHKKASHPLPILTLFSLSLSLSISFVRLEPWRDSRDGRNTDRSASRLSA